MMKKMYLCLAALVAVSLLSSCADSSDTDSSKVQTDSTSSVGTTTVEESSTVDSSVEDSPSATESPEEENSEESSAAEESASSEKEQGDPSGDFTIEDAFELAKAGTEAMREKDWDKIVEYTDIELLYYNEYEKQPSSDELIQAIKDWTEPEDGVMYDISPEDWIFGAFKEELKFKQHRIVEDERSVGLMNELLLTEYPEGATELYEVTDAYFCECGKDGSGVFVINIGGEWKLDVVLSFVLEIYGEYNDYDFFPFTDSVY